MKNKKLLAGMLAAVLSVTTICSTTNVMQAQETTGTTQASEVTTETGDVVIPKEEIPDENLYNAILQQADSNEDGILTVLEAESVTELESSGNGVDNLQGIQYCKNLEWLGLSNDAEETNKNQISDISMLAALQNLTRLGLSYNALNEDAMDTIQKMESLERLELAGNQLTNEDVAKLSNLTSLELLDLSDNQISDISPLASLTNMWYIYVADNQINDIRAFANMANLYRIDISKNQISDISVLSEIPNLESIFAAHNQITDISAFSHKELWVMDLSYNQISTIKDLYLRVDWELHLQHNQLDALDAEYIYSDLVDMSYNKIKKIEVGSLVSGSVDLSHNEIRDLNGIENFSGLNMEGIVRGLYLSNNLIEDVSPLAKIDLYGLDLSNNNIYDITSLANLIDLYTLNLSNNKIRDISALDGLKENGCEITTDGNPIGEPEEPQKPSEPSKPVFTPDDFAELLERQDIVIKPNDYVTITFSKGSEINDTTGKTEYNFTTTVTTDFANAKLPAFITQNSFITKVSYTYSGVLPATANIDISVGKDHKGKEVFYFLLNEDGTFNKNEVQKVKVNENGVITVKQEHCSDYVVTTVNPETLYAATQTPNEDPNTNDSPTSTENNGNANNGSTNTDTDGKESPKTGDRILFGTWCTVILSGIMAIFVYKRRHAE